MTLQEEEEEGDQGNPLAALASTDEQQQQQQQADPSSSTDNPLLRKKVSWIITTDQEESNTTQPRSCSLPRKTRHVVASVIRVPWYRPPSQRQRWGDTQMHPHTNWGDIFFDLFYVAAAYNLGTILKEDPTSRGLLYVVACFVPIMMLWSFKLLYDSRFYVKDDMFHRFYEVAVLLALATAVLHIRPVAIMANPKQEMDTFIFALALVVAYALAMGRYVEIMLCNLWIRQRTGGGDENDIAEERDALRDNKGDPSDDKDEQADNDNNDDETSLSSRETSATSGSSVTIGDGLYPESFYAARRESLWCLSFFGFYVAAAVYSGIQYYGYQAKSSGKSDYPKTYPSNSTNETAYNDTKATSDLHRGLAGSSSVYPPAYSDDIPIYLILGGALMAISAMTFLVAVFLSPRFCKWRGVDSNTITVPMNIAYCIHRYAEWTMLMMGESVLSLLIVPLVEKDILVYLQIFYCGILSISILQYLHFRSQPHDPDEHALRRSRYSGILFSLLFQVYSIALVILGTSYKMMLYESVHEAKYSAKLSKRSLASTVPSRSSLPTIRDLAARLLAAGDSAALRFSTRDRQQRIAYFFAGSLAVVWFCLDVISLSHKGVKANWERTKMECAKRAAIIRFYVVILVLARVGLIAFAATIFLYVTDPEKLAVIGLFGIFAQVLLRFLGEFIFPLDREEEEAKCDALVAEYTAARVREGDPDASE